jgi:NifU-like protein involved in Fe-S cluster formation
MVFFVYFFMSELSSTIIQSYAKSPPNRGTLLGAHIVYTESNRNCGDTVTISLIVGSDNAIADAHFDGHLTIIATACASIMLEYAIGKPVNTILGYNLLTVLDIIGIDISPRRRMSAVFGILALRNAIHQWKNDGIIDDFSAVIPSVMSAELMPQDITI